MRAESTSEGRGLEDVVSVLRPRILAIMARYQIPTADGDDLLQEAILAALEQRKPIANLQAWLLTVVRNRCSVYQRRQSCWKRLVQTVDPSELQALATPIEPPQEYQAACRDLRRLWRHLSEDDKKLLQMCFGQDLGRKEVAAQFRCHPANIAKLLRRVLARLRAAASLRTVFR